METRIGELRMKEVVSIRDGSRFGYLGDLEIDLESGRIRTLIIPGRMKLFGLLGREPERTVAWQSVRRFGEDIILVDEDMVQQISGQEKEKKN